MEATEETPVVEETPLTEAEVREMEEAMVARYEEMISTEYYYAVMGG